MKAECKRWLERKIARIQSLETYGAEKTNESIAKQVGLSPSQILKLNYNENLYLQREKLVPLLKEVADECDLRIYPQEEENRLKEKIGEYLQVPEESVAIGNSSDEVMDRIIRIFLEKGDRAVTFMPTFSIFKYCVNYGGADFVGVPLRDDFTIDFAGMEATFTPDAKLLYLCSPNNPTANQLKRREIEALMEAFPGIVLVDEAYAEYADYSVVPLINKYENLIVLRTFSKAFGLAGLRLGYAVANPKLATTIDRLPTPYAVNVVSLSMGRKLLENYAMVRESVEELKIERGKMINRLNEINGVEAFDSKANFVVFNTEKPYEEVYLNMLKKGLVIKKLGKLLKYPNCLRSTVGRPEVNEKLLKALQEYLR
ncbi:MAG TPA: histidinol-phosphate transaminase [Candidatus Bathyarchaeia archaeon]|nr:histidinol-phosphate transaminase [Candidatus Bathyarchaeia archaeon]